MVRAANNSSCFEDRFFFPPFFPVVSKLQLTGPSLDSQKSCWHSSKVTWDASRGRPSRYALFDADNHLKCDGLGLVTLLYVYIFRPIETIGTTQLFSIPADLESDRPITKSRCRHIKQNYSSLR